MTPLLRLISCVAVCSLSRGTDGSTRLTTMTTSAQRSRATSTGMLRTMPPSARMYLSVTTGREGTRDGHAGAHGRRQVAVPQDDHVARQHVGRDGTEGNRQPVEIGLHAGAGDVCAQQVLDAGGIDDAARHDDPLVLQAHLEVVAVGDAGALLLDRLQVALAHAAHHRFQSMPIEEHLEVPGRNTRGVPRADQGSHAGAGDAVDRHVQFLEHLEHAHVGAALGAAACQHQPDLRPGCLRRGDLRLGLSGRRGERNDYRGRKGHSCPIAEH